MPSVSGLRSKPWASRVAQFRASGIRETTTGGSLRVRLMKAKQTRKPSQLLYRRGRLTFWFGNVFPMAPPKACDL